MNIEMKEIIMLHVKKQSVLACVCVCVCVCVSLYSEMRHEDRDSSFCL